MGKKTIKDKRVELKVDALLKSFWKDKQRFADLFNTCLFAGETVICPEQLVEQDSVSAESLESAGWIESVERIRDVIKMSALGTDFVLLGIENQDKIHYAMPLRTMVYDAMGYVKQCKEIERQNRRQRRSRQNEADNEINADEYLGRFRKTDRLLAQYTIVIYYGEQEWDGPKSLKEMLRSSEKMEPFIQDYRMNLLEARLIDYSKFATEDVSTFFQLIHISSDKERMLENYEGLEVTSEVLLVAGEVCKMRTWTELALERKGEVIQVCKAWEEAKEVLREEGRTEGRAEGRQDFLSKIIKSNLMTPELAKCLEIEIDTKETVPK